MTAVLYDFIRLYVSASLFQHAFSLATTRKIPNDCCVYINLNCQPCVALSCCVGTECSPLTNYLPPQNDICLAPPACPISARVEDQADGRPFEARFDECMPDKIIMETERGEADVSGRWVRHLIGVLYQYIVTRCSG